MRLWKNRPTRAEYKAACGRRDDLMGEQNRRHAVELADAEAQCIRMQGEVVDARAQARELRELLAQIRRASGYVQCESTSHDAASRCVRPAGHTGMHISDDEGWLP